MNTHTPAHCSNCLSQIFQFFFYMATCDVTDRGSIYEHFISLLADEID